MKNKKVLVDSDILSYYMKQLKIVVNNFNNHLSENDYVYISRISVIEILGGLKARNATKQIRDFKKMIEQHKILDTTALSAEISAEIYAELRQKGKHSGNYDILIAGIAIANDLILITNNVKDYENINDLEIENWTQRTK